MRKADLGVDKPMGYGLMKPILDAVTREYKMSEAVLVAPGGTDTPAEARQVCCWLARKITRLSGHEIGRVLGRDKYHTGFSVKRIEQKRLSDAYILQLTDRLLSELQSSSGGANP